MNKNIVLPLLLTCLISSTAFAGKGDDAKPCLPKTAPAPLPEDVIRLAMPGQATPEGFCANPYLSICASYGGGNEYREKNYRKFMDDASMHALEELAQRYRIARLTSTLHGPDGLKNGLAVLNEFPGQRAEYETLRARYIQTRSHAIERDTMTVYAEKARGYVIKGIDAQVRLGNLDKDTAAEMRSSITDTKILPDFDRAALAALPEDTRNHIAKSYAYWCHADGLSDNAFQSTVDGQRYVIFCPGTFLRAQRNGDDSIQNYRNIFSTIAHELGHTVDPEFYPKTYGKFLGCVANGDLGSLSTEGGSWQGSAEDIEKSLRSSIAQSHKREIVADYWAVQAQVAYFNDAPLLGAQERFDMIRQVYSGFCGGSDEGIHPVGYYRIAKVVGLDLGLRKALGCSTASAPTEAACGLR